MRSSLPFLAPFGLGIVAALYFATQFDDDRAWGIAVLLAIGAAFGAVTMREEEGDYELGPALAAMVGAQTLEPHWAKEVLGPWFAGPRLFARWIVAREESWGSLYLLRCVIGKSGRETHLVLSVQGSALPTLTARRKRAPRPDRPGEPGEWDVTSDPGTDEQLVSWIIEAIEPLSVTAFQIDGKKLWCRLRDPGVSLFGGSSKREQALATKLEQAAELGRELRRLRP